MKKQWGRKCAGLCQKVLNLVEEALSEGGPSQFYVRWLVGFADGLSDRLRLLIMKDNRTTVQEAINTAR